MPNVDEARAQANAIKLAAGDAPVKIAQPVLDAAQAVLDGLIAAQQAQADAAGQFGNPALSGQEQIRRANSGMSAAIKQATGAVSTLDSAATTALAQMQKYFLPGRSRDMTDADIADRKEDLRAVVMAIKGDNAVDRMDKVGKLLSRAILEDDLLTQYVMCAKLSFIYDAAGLGRDLVNARLSHVIASKSDAGTAPSGAAFLAVLSRGDAGTPKGLIDLARSFLYQLFSAYRSWVESMISGGQVQGVPSTLPQYRDWQDAMNALDAAVNGQPARANWSNSSSSAQGRPIS